MSLARFLNETHQLMNSGLTVDEAQNKVRDQWLASKNYPGIVSAILGNWTSGNCVEFMLPVSKALLDANELALHRQLWARTIKRQVDSAFRSYAHVRRNKNSFEGVTSVDWAGFNEFDFHAYDDHHAATSFLLNRLVKSLELWRQGLKNEGMRTEEVDDLESSIRALKKPTIRVDAHPQAST